MLFVCTPVTGSLKWREWFTVLWDDTLGREVTLLYAAHSSLHISVLGLVWRWMMGSNVAAFLWSTNSRMPNAGVWLVSTMPKTHTGDGGECPRWCYGWVITFIQKNNKYDKVPWAYGKNKTRQSGPHLGEQDLNHPVSCHHGSIGANYISLVATDRCQLRPYWKPHIHWLLESLDTAEPTNKSKS